MRPGQIRRDTTSRPVPRDEAGNIIWSSLSRSQGLSRSGLAVVRGDGAPVAQIRPQRRKDTGPSPAVRRLVLERDGHACVCCGVSIIGRRYSLGHRLRASQGGKAVPENLLTFLGWGGEECHGRIDSRRYPEDEAKGYTVRSWQDPALIPVMLFSQHGSGVTAWLLTDGTYSYEPPGGCVA